MFSNLKILELNYIVKFMYVECRSIFRIDNNNNNKYFR